MKCSCNSHGTFLTAKGLAEAAQREFELASIFDVGIDRDEEVQYLDKVGSVSGSTRFASHWDDALIDQQYRRFHNGS